MKLKKFKLKNILMISMLAVAGVFGATSVTLSKYTDKHQIVEEAEASTNKGIYEKVGNTTYRVIYFFADSRWEYGRVFGGNNSSWRYKYTTSTSASPSGSEYTVLQFGKSNSSSFNEIIGTYAAKIYLPSDVTWFGIRTREEYNSDPESIYINTPNHKLLDTDQAFINRYDYYNSRDNQDVWITKRAFFNMFVKNYLTVSTEWQGGESALANRWVGSYYTSEENPSVSNVERASPLANCVKTTATGKHYAEYLIPVGDGNTRFCLAKEPGAGYFNEYGENITAGDLKPDYLYTITSNRTGADNRNQTITYLPFSMDTYLYKPTFARIYFNEGSWANSYSPRISTSAINTDDKFNSATLFTSKDETCSNAQTSYPTNSYFHIDITLSGATKLYFGFRQIEYEVSYIIRKQGSSWDGEVGTFSPGYIYQIEVNGYYSKNGTNKWAYMTITTIGYFASFSLDCGVRSASESFDHKEFRSSSSYAANLMKEPTKSGYTFMGWKANSDGMVNKADTSYTLPSPMGFVAQWISNTQDVVTKDTARIWIGYNGTSDQVFYKSGVPVAILLQKEGEEYSYYYYSSGTYYNPTEHIDSDNNRPRRYDYFDIDISFVKNGWTMNFVRLQSDTEWVSGFWVNLSEDNYFKIYYGSHDWSYGSVTIGGLDNTTSLFASLAICGMHTCSDEKINGSKGFDHYYDTFVKSDAVVNYMVNYDINDYESLSDYSSDYDINKLTNGYNKYLWCQWMYNGQTGQMPRPGLGNFLGLFGDDNNVMHIIIIIASSVSLLSITALSVLLVKKRKKYTINK